MGKQSLMSIRIDDELRHRFKTALAANRTTMRECIEQFIKEYVEAHKASSQIE